MLILTYREKTMLTVLLIIVLLVLVGMFWKDVIPAGASLLSVIIGAIWAWFVFWWIVDAIFG